MDTSEFTDEQIEALQALADGYNDQSVSRRDVMKLVGAGGVGALLGGGGAASAVDRASAGTAQSGQLGSVGSPLDLVTEDVMDQQGNVVASANAGALEGTDLRYDAVTTDDAIIDDRPYTTTQDRTVNVPGDYATVQQAVNQVPFLMRHEWTINIDDGVYNEDVLVPPMHGLHASLTKNEFRPLTIEGNTTTPTNVEINSLYITGAIGGFFGVYGLSMGESTPYDNEDSCINVQNSHEVDLGGIEFISGSAGNGILSYSSTVHVGNINVGASLLNIALETKHNGRILEDSGVNTTLEGNATAIGYLARQGYIVFNSDTSTLTADTYLASGYDGWVVNGQTGSMYLTGVGGSGGGVIVKDSNGSADRYRIRVNNGAVEAEGPL